MSERDELRELLTDAVADVEPAYRLDAIRARTRRAHPRRGWLAAGGAIVAAAAVVTAVSVVNDDPPRRHSPAAPGTEAVGLYFVGETPAGPRLNREFQRLPTGDALAALEAITTAQGPDDPDYGSIWPGGYFERVSIDNGVIRIGVGKWNAGPLEISAEGARLSIQQVVYTAQSALNRTLPVRFDGVDRPDFADSIGDIPLTREFNRAPQSKVLSLVSISDPTEGLPVNGSFTARGRADSFEATVPWRIEDPSGQVVADGFATATGWGGRLYPWETQVDVSDLEPGRYTFVASTDDPSGGAEGPGPFTDTRTIIVE